ncbi:sugar kinase [uncultured Marivita sp.]|uniref:sugar kinase n=1 Tax=uncultured Marivita sp. TaxID=888080 RepID=UPI00260CA9BF|nr:sugar kinase [uncultured Marivita sp.]
MRFLAIGECMAELAPSDAPGEYRLGFAGDTFNTAWYMARVAPQVSVAYLTAVGEDRLSQSLTEFMQASGIDTRAVQTNADRTVGLYLISLDNGERSFSYWRGQSAARTLADDPERLARAMSDADLIYFSGITLAILAPDKRATLLKALREARAQGRTIAFDPNLRPRLWESPDVMRNTIMQGAAVSDIALPSFEDEASWFADATPRATAQRYLDAGVMTVVVKNGPSPVLYAEGERFGEVPVTALDRVTDTTAAGDSFNAGFFAGHATGQSLADGITYACALSREVVQHRGALVDADLPPLPKG